MKTIQLETEMPQAEIEARAGRFMEDSDYNFLAGEESVTVLKPNGSPLLIYVKDVLPRSLCKQAFGILKQVDVESGGTNRGMAAGIIEDSDDPRIDAFDTENGPIELVGRGTRYYPKKDDGSLSGTARAAAVPTAIIGFFDRYPRIPFCRQTSFTMNKPELWVQALPYIQRVSAVFKEYAPEHYAKQQDFIRTVHPDYVIPGTVFSTLTVNRSWRTALHTDQGDFINGLGCMTVLEGGSYQGANLVFPRYRCAVNMRTGSVCLADVHSHHGNTPLVGLPGQFVRMSTVFYARAKLQECGSLEFELDRAKRIGDNVSTRHATEERRLF